jgi:putative transposase
VVNARARAPRADFIAWTAGRLVRDHGLVVVEDLRASAMTRSAKGTAEAPGRRVRQKAGRTGPSWPKGWGGFVTTLEHVARYHGAQIVTVDPAYTSLTCHACKHVARESRESRAVFRYVACGHEDDADVNAARTFSPQGMR